MRLNRGFLGLNGRKNDTVSSLTLLQSALSGSTDSAIVDFTDATNTGTYTAPDLLGSNDFVQATAINQPGISTILGATMDGSNDFAGYTHANATFSIVLAMVKDATDTDGFIITSGMGTGTEVRFTSGNAVALSFTCTVDGVAVTTRGELYTALNDGAEHTVVISGLNMSATTTVGIGRQSAAMLGSVRRIVTIDEADVTAADVRPLAVTWVEEL